MLFEYRRSSSHISSSKASNEILNITKEEIHSTNTEKENIIFNELSSASTSSNDVYDQFEKAFSSTSELNLSNLTPTNDESSSLSLTTVFDNVSDDETNASRSITPTQLTSDTESVLYVRLTEELKIIEATWESDLERIDELNSPER